MKHFSKIAIVLFCVSVLLLQSCKKETNGLFRLSATIEKYNHDNKVHIETDREGSYACWDVGDQVAINGHVAVVGHELDDDNDYYYIQSTDGYNFADLGGHQEFAALYPTTLFLAGDGEYHGSTQVNLPQTQNYIVGGSNGTQKIEAPMMAYMAAGVGEPPDNNHTMQFKNVCALIKVNITNSSNTSVGINRIEIVNKADHPFWGQYSSNLSSSDQSITESGTPEAEKKVITRKATINVNGQTIGAGANKSFYIYVPAVAYSNLVLTVFTTDNKYRTYTGSVSGTFSANTIYSKSITYDGGTDWKTINSPSGDVDGVFTVSATTIDGVTTYKKVKFAHGNLLPDGSFFTNQYDYKGWYGNNTDRYTSIPTTLPSGYSLLTSAEWSYLIGNNSRGSMRYVNATVNFIPGVILFPDGFQTPSGSGISFEGLNQCNYDWNANSFNLEQWSTLESLGCVFLPRISWSGVNTITIAAHYMMQDGRVYQFGGLYSPMVGDVTSYGAYIRLVKVQPSTTK